MYYLTERWSISRGRDTYGYNICAIEGSNSLGDRFVQSRCCGGGYDMAGMSLAGCLSQIPEVMTRLSALESLDDLYGVFRGKDGQIYMDGACGRESIREAMKSINVEVRPDYRARGKRNPMERVGWFVEVK